jgi:hypothetical protein
MKNTNITLRKKTKMKTTKDYTISTQDLKSVRCGLNHSGKHTLHHSGGYYQCAGCATFYSAAEIRSRLESPGGQIGSGGVISA